VMKKAQVFCPAGISSFFEICDRTHDGKRITDLERVGARGGGFAIEKGVLTEVSAIESEERSIRVFINDKPAPEAETEIPIGAGFGSSAGGALGTAFALSKILNINLTCNQLGRIAHVAEVKCHTGLGTVGPLMLGGCVITVEPGAPGYASIDRIPISSDHRIITVTYRPFPTKEMLSSQEKRLIINKWGRRTVDKILAEPSLENFMLASKEFAIKTGLVTDRVQKLIELAEKAGAVGAAQNMVGEAVHALVTVDRAEAVAKAFKRVAPSERIIIARIDFQGARWLR